ncbi:MAG: amino acid permease [Methanobacteriota archaeon]|nr:MAG: amino acid permease [Euryarchaeota archaeon]
MAEPSPSDTVRIKVTPDLGLPDVVVLGLSAMVGAGVFVLAGTVARVAGVAAILGIGMAAFVVLLNSLAYAELAGARPNAAGGGYGWVRETLPPPTGFVSGWLSWAGHLAAAALSAAGIGLLADYLLDEVLGVPGIPVGIPLGGGTYNVSEKVLAAVVFLAFVAARTRPHARIRRFPWVGALKITLVALFVGVGAVALTRVPDLAAKFGSPLSPGPVAGITLAAGIFFVAFQGFETIAQSADRVKSPHRTVPAGIFIALGIAVVLYLTFYLVALGNVATNTPTCTTAWDCLAQGPRDLREPELGSFFAASSIAGATGWPVLLFLVAAVFAMTTALDSNLGSATRAVFTMARDGSLPKSLGRIGERTHAPVVAQLAGGGVGLLFLLPLSIEGLAATAGILFLILYTLVNFALIAERRRQRTAARGFRGVLVPVVPALTAAVNLALAIDLYGFPRLADEVAPAGQVAWYAVGLWLAIGLLFHYFAGGRRAVTEIGGKPRVELLDVLAAKEDRFDPARYRVFLPLREFDDPELVEFGAVVAKERDGELSLLNVVEIPGNLPPKAIKFRYMDDRIRGLQKLARIGERMGVDTRPVVKIGNRVYEIILDTLKEEDVNLLVMGWRGERVEGDRRILGSNIDYLIENAPCDVVVFKTKGLTRPLRRIVVLSSPLWSVRGVDALALILAKSQGAKITVLSIVEDPAKAEEVKGDARGLLEDALALGLEVEQKIVYSKAFESTALQESAGADLLLVRASPPGGLRRYALGPVEDRIAKLAKVPVLIFRKGAK